LMYCPTNRIGALLCGARSSDVGLDSSLIGVSGYLM